MPEETAGQLSYLLPFYQEFPDQNRNPVTGKMKKGMEGKEMSGTFSLC